MAGGRLSFQRSPPEAPPSGLRIAPSADDGLSLLPFPFHRLQRLPPQTNRRVPSTLCSAKTMTPTLPGRAHAPGPRGTCAVNPPVRPGLAAKLGGHIPNRCIALGPFKKDLFMAGGGGVEETGTEKLKQAPH